jgi:hypothetical protein
MRFANWEASPVDEFRLPTCQLVSTTFSVEEMIMSDELKNALKQSRKKAEKIAFPIFIGSGLVAALWVNTYLLAEVLGPV